MDDPPTGCQGSGVAAGIKEELLAGLAAQALLLAALQLVLSALDALKRLTGIKIARKLGIGIDAR
jgi:hypothetical protein